MSERHVVLRVGRRDRHLPPDAVRDRLILTLDGKGDNPATDVQQHHLWTTLDRLGLEPPQVAIDLYRICAAAYCADLRLDRAKGYDDWTREILLHVPVSEVELWQTQVPTLERLLSFLSGDIWHLRLREGKVPIPAVEPANRRRAARQDGDEERDKPALDVACLFSGGLDSFIGAADALAQGQNPLLVSHNPEGNARFMSPAQDGLRNGLAKAYAGRRIEHLKVSLNPPRRVKGAKRQGEDENTQRVRSILFLGLGTLAASAVGAGTPLIVPENGFISLNLPLTPGRLGSLSTRTTHPYAIALYRHLLEGLGIGVPVEVPYMFHTKGEMLRNATDPQVVANLAPASLSCASPNPRSEAQDRHCGYCVPCIIRRAAMSAAGIDSTEDYRLDLLKPGRALSDAEASHLLGFELAVRRRAGGVSLPGILAAGDLPRSIGSVSDFRSVHDRGLSEVASFLRGGP